MEKTKRRLDLLSWSFVAAAVLCVTVSLPATYQMATLTHSPELAVALVAVLEVMAFGAKLGSRWVPSWEQTLDSITKALLSLVLVGNFADGWTSLHREPLEGFWSVVAGFDPWGLPVGAALIVGPLSAMVPVGTYLFLSLFVKRQRELDAENDPEREVERRLAPVVAQLQVIGELDRQLAELLNQRQQLYQPVLPPPEPVFPAPRLDEPPPERDTIQLDGTETEEQTPVTQPTESASERSCAKCGRGMSLGEWGAAAKHQRRNRLPARVCADCR